MIPLALLAVLIYSTGIQLLLFLRKGNIQLGHESEWTSWIYDPSQAKGRAGEIIRYTQENISESKHLRSRFEEVRQSMLHTIERRMTFLNTLVAAAPLMGLLGTVIGMLGTFAAISSGGGAETAAMVAAGISEALITTQTGLFIALPGIFLVLIIRRRKHAVEAALARIEATQPHQAETRLIIRKTETLKNGKYNPNPNPNPNLRIHSHRKHFRLRARLRLRLRIPNFPTFLLLDSPTFKLCSLLTFILSHLPTFPPLNCPHF